MESVVERSGGRGGQCVPTCVRVRACVLGFARVCNLTFTSSHKVEPSGVGSERWTDAVSGAPGLPLTLERGRTVVIVVDSSPETWVERKAGPFRAAPGTSEEGDLEDLEGTGASLRWWERAWDGEREGRRTSTVRARWKARSCCPCMWTRGGRAGARAARAGLLRCCSK